MFYCYKEFQSTALKVFYAIKNSKNGQQPASTAHPVLRKKQRRPLLHLLSSPIALKDTGKAQQAVGISPANVH